MGSGLAGLVYSAALNAHERGDLGTHPNCELANGDPCVLSVNEVRQIMASGTLQGIEQVTTADVQRVAADLFRNGSLAATVLGNVNGLQIPAKRLDLD